MYRGTAVVTLVAALLAGAACLAVSRGQPPEGGTRVISGPRIEYKAMRRSDVEDLAPQQGRAGKPEGSSAEALTAGLNVLAGQGWELVAVEPYWQTQAKEVQATVTFHHYPTYVFKRTK